MGDLVYIEVVLAVINETSVLLRNVGLVIIYYGEGYGINGCRERVVFFLLSND